MDERKRARRLSSVHYLPRTADVALAEAIDAAIISNTMTQSGALQALNEKLSALKVTLVGKSSWHRFLSHLLEDGVPMRWQLVANAVAPETGDTITIAKARYIALLETENKLLRMGVAD